MEQVMSKLELIDQAQRQVHILAALSETLECSLRR